MTYMYVSRKCRTLSGRDLRVVLTCKSFVVYTLKIINCTKEDSEVVVENFFFLKPTSFAAAQKLDTVI